MHFSIILNAEKALYLTHKVLLKKFACLEKCKIIMEISELGIVLMALNLIWHGRNATEIVQISFLTFSFSIIHVRKVLRL